MKLRGMTFFRLLKDASVKRYKAINSEEIDSTHAQFFVFVSKYNILKALIQLPRNTEDHAIAYFTPNFVIYFVQRRLSKLAIVILWPNYTRTEEIPSGSHNQDR